MQPTPVEPQVEAARRSVVYEQPLNERMRTFLRVEFLYQQALYHNATPNAWSSRAAVASLLEILAIPGVGPRTVKELHDALGVLTLDDVEAAARAGRIRGLRGMTPRTEERILEGIEAMSRRTRRLLLGSRLAPRRRGSRQRLECAATVVR